MKKEIYKFIIIGFGEIGQYTALTIQNNIKNNKDYNIDIQLEAVDIKKDIDIIYPELKNIKIKQSILDINFADKNILITCLPTNVKFHQDNLYYAYLDFEPFHQFFEDLEKLYKNNKDFKFDLWINRSTVHPKFLEVNNEKVKAKYIVAAPERYNSKVINHTKTFDSENIVIGYNEIDSNFRSLLELLKPKNKEIYFTGLREAEASKLFENVQRHILISLENLFYLYCEKNGINYKETHKAAQTKSNYIKNIFPGIVGGHCIGIDDFWFAYDSLSRERDIIDHFYLNDIDFRNKIKEKIKKKILESKDKDNFILLGLTYKPNSDSINHSNNLRLFKELREELKKENIDLKAYDPLVDKKIGKEIDGWIDLEYFENLLKLNEFKFVILVDHKIFKNYRKNFNIVFDIKDEFK